MNIAVRLEGGIGDHLMASRFVPAIKEKYPQSKITAFSDSNGNIAQADVLIQLFPSLFEDIKVIPCKKDPEFKIISQFGQENYISHIDNIPEEYLLQMRSYDKFYDLHLDGLKWMDYDFNWSKYFYRFLEIETQLNNPLLLNGSYIAVNLYSDSNKANLLESWYVEALLKKLSEHYRIVVICTNKNIKMYESCKDFVTLFAGDIKEVAAVINDAAMFLTIDSGLKFISYSTGTPSLNFLNQCTEYGAVPFHQIIRWQPYPLSVIPLHFDIEKLLKLINFTIKNRTNILPYTENIDQLLIKRIFN